MSKTFGDIFDRVVGKMAAKGEAASIPPEKLAEIVKFSIAGLAEEFAQGDEDLKRLTAMKEIWADEDWNRVLPDIIAAIEG